MQQQKYQMLTQVGVEVEALSHTASRDGRGSRRKGPLEEPVTPPAFPGRWPSDFTPVLHGITSRGGQEWVALGGVAPGQTVAATHIMQQQHQLCLRACDPGKPPCCACRERHWLMLRSYAQCRPMNHLVESNPSVMHNSGFTRRLQLMGQFPCLLGNN